MRCIVVQTSSTSRTGETSVNLSTGVGATATLVAAGRARATKAAPPLIDDPFAVHLVKAVGIDFLTRWATGELQASEIDERDAAWGLERMTLDVAARTRYFDRFLLEASAADIRQVVILASGLDARAFRLQWPAGTRVFEIDHPEVLRFKSATLAEMGAVSPAELHMVPADLSAGWADELRSRGFDPQQPCAWIAEGLLGYLPPEAQDRLLDDITALSAPASRLAVETFVGSDELDAEHVEKIIRGATQRWRAHGWHLDIWALTHRGVRNEVGAYLDGHGWRSTGITAAQLLIDNDVPAAIARTDQTREPLSYYTAILP